VSRNLKTALALVSISLVSFIGIIVKFWILRGS
jgi:hypothetical protein